MQTTTSSSSIQYLIEIFVDPVVIHWPTIINDMRERGLSYLKQAHSIDCEWSTFQRWLNGSQPQFKNGHSLLILHARICGIPLTQQRLREFSSKL